jgi:hypothetical protein
MRFRMTRWQCRLTDSFPDSEKEFVPSLQELESIANAAISGLPGNLTLAWAPLGDFGFLRPELGTTCLTVEIQAVVSMKLGWYHPKALGTDRAMYGSMVLGPSGIGKTYLMVHQVPKQLAKTCAPLKGQQPAVLLTLGATLGGLLTKSGLDLAEADTVLDFIAKRIKEQVPMCWDKYCKDNAGAHRLFVHLVIDEIGVCPGLFSAEARFHRLASTIWDSVLERIGPDIILGVHVSVGGTAAESPEVRLASHLDTVKKIRLAPWLAKTAINLVPLCDADRRKLLDYLAKRSALVRAVLSVPRMAVPLVETLRTTDFPRASGPAFWHEGAVIPLCERAIASYCSQNGIQKLQEAIDCNRDTRLMAVGACALAAVMLQRSDGQVADNGLKWKQSVPFAEHLGFVVCNLGPDNTVECGSYPYTMPPGLALVALWLMRIPWVFLADWSSLETQAALQQSLRVAVFASLSFEALRPSEGAPRLSDLWPSALRHLKKFPVLQNINGPTCILPAQWSSDMGPRLCPSSDSSLEKVIVADFPTLEHTTPSAGLRWTPRPLISVPLAAAPDVYGHRCFVQCKFSFPTDPSNGLVADLEEEMRKAGLLQAPSDPGDTQARRDLHLKQRLTCDLMLHHWRACELQYPALLSDLTPPDLDQPSTAFDRYMYPLCELTAGLVGKKFTTWSTRRSDEPASEAVAEPAARDCADDQEGDDESHGTAPRPSPPRP